MAWNEPATDKQISALINLLRWTIPDNEQLGRLSFLKRTRPTRSAISKELGRLRDLKGSRRLTPGVAFKSEIWNGYRGPSQSVEDWKKQFDERKKLREDFIKKCRNRAGKIST